MIKIVAMTISHDGTDIQIVIDIKILNVIEALYFDFEIFLKNFFIESFQESSSWKGIRHTFIIESMDELRYTSVISNYTNLLKRAILYFSINKG